jgi:hypothetical protein
MTAQENAALIERFYGAFQKRDATTMAACYHGNVRFRDPVFSLDGENAGLMWKMLCARGADLRVEFANVAAAESSGCADWQAWYTFSGTGRPVHNVIRAGFRFADGLIVEHIDKFDFWRWSRQALGPAGAILGWSPFLRRKVQAQAAAALARFTAQSPA